MSMIDEDITVHLIGDLNFTTVPALTKDNQNVILKKPRVIFDLSKVTSSDNTGVALLVTLAGFAKNIQKEISFVNLPEQLLDLVEAVGVKDILPIGK